MSKVKSGVLPEGKLQMSSWTGDIKANH